MDAQRVRTQRKSNAAPAHRPARLRLFRRPVRPLRCAGRGGVASSRTSRGSAPTEWASPNDERTSWRLAESGAKPKQVSTARPGFGKILANRYWLGRRIGAGATASVFEAVDMKDDRRVAIKLLHPELQEDAGLRVEFVAQAVAATRVRHSGVARVLEVSDREEGPAFLVMDRLWGETLEERGSRLGPRWDTGEVAVIVYELLDVLAAAHDEGVVHCDIKPSNVFLTDDGAVKLLDFGAARLAEVQASAAGPTPVGTPGFMPPEQILGPSAE